MFACPRPEGGQRPARFPSPTAPYRNKGFADPANPGQVWAHVLVTGERKGQLSTDPDFPLPLLRFGPGAPSGSDRSGGFLTPNIPIRALSRVNGVGGDPAGMAAKNFDPVVFFKDSNPKLFGLIELTNVTVTVDSDLARMPEVIQEFLGRIECLIKEIGRASEAIADRRTHGRRYPSAAVSRRSGNGASRRRKRVRATLAKGALTASATN